MGTHSVSPIRQSGYVLFRRRCPPESPSAVLAVAGERRMNPVIGRQIACTDPPSGVVNVERIQRGALTPRALLQLAPVAGKVAVHMPDADSAIVHGECHAYSCVTLSLRGRTRILQRGRVDINEFTLPDVDLGDPGVASWIGSDRSNINNARFSST